MKILMISALAILLCTAACKKANQRALIRRFLMRH